jgi:DNA-directed RNA polymerase specialized sigma subunit
LLETEIDELAGRGREGRVANHSLADARRLQQEYERDPTAAELGAVLGLPAEQVRELPRVTP